MTKVIGEYDDRDVSLLAVDQYFRWVRHLAWCSPEEEAALFERVVRGRGPDGSLSPDAQAARDRLLEGYQGWVIQLASRFARRCRVLERMDLIQVGQIALLQTIAEYDAAVVYSIPGWICRRLHYAMSAAMLEQDAGVRLTQRNRVECNLLRRTEHQLTEDLRRVPTDAELAAALQVSVGKIRDWREIHQWRRVESLHQVIEEREDEEERFDFVSLFEHFVQQSNWRSERVREAVESALTKRQREVVQLRYGMDEQDSREQTQREIAARFGVTDAAVGAAEKDAYRRLSPVLATSCAIAVEATPAVLVCGWCGREFPPRFGVRRDREYCSNQCRGAARRAGQAQEVA